MKNKIKYLFIYDSVIILNILKREYKFNKSHRIIEIYGEDSEHYLEAFTIYGDRIRTYYHGVPISLFSIIYQLEKRKKCLDTENTIDKIIEENENN